MSKPRYSILILLAGCVTAPSEQNGTEPAARPLAAGIDTAGFDTTVRPQDDFFAYVNGRWLAETNIPPEKSNYGSFVVLADESDQRLRQIVEDAAGSDAEPGSEMQKIGDFYLSFMDVERVDALGITPIADDLDRIAAIRNRRDLAAYLGYTQRIGVPAPLGFWIGQDNRNTREYMVNFTQSGLGLPDREYYLATDEAAAELRQAYVAYLDRLFELAGFEAGAGVAILGFETRLARIQWSRTKARNRDLTYNKRTRNQFRAMLAGFDIRTYLDAAGLGDQPTFNVREPDYVENFVDIAAETPLPIWKNYLRARLIAAAAPYLSGDFVNANFEFYDRKLSGVETIEPRWKRAVQNANALMGEMIGKFYVERHFQADAKSRMDTLVANLIAAFGEGIDELEWMGPETRIEAQAKLAKFTTKIGFPDEWRDYTALQIRPDDLAGNIKRARMFEVDRELAKLGAPVDRHEWYMHPQTVNAYYNPPMNEIVFPAALLQPPFFNVTADDAVNYGAIGAVIGHEISHGFDDQGRKSDGDGMLRNWWTDKDNEEFSRRAAGLVAQFEEFEPLPGERINGKFTLGENIGDLSGLAVAYRAYRKSLHGQQGPVIDGMTADQRFFIGYAQVWRRKYRDSELKRRLVIDPHSPAEYRVLGILPNIDAFYDAFDVQQGDAMYLPPDKRVKIW